MRVARAAALVQLIRQHSDEMEPKTALTVTALFCLERPLQSGPHLAYLKVIKQAEVFLSVMLCGKPRVCYTYMCLAQPRHPGHL